MANLNDELIFNGEIKDGELIIASEEFMKKKVSKQPDCKVHIEIRKKKSKRSIDQNNLYWMYLEDIATETGNDRYTLHEHFKQKFLFKGEQLVEIDGIETSVPMYGSSANLGKGEFADFMLNIEAETGVPIPDTEGYLLDLIHNAQSKAYGKD